MLSRNGLFIDEAASLDPTRARRLPRRPELRALCMAFLEEPGSNAVAADWAARFGMTEKTLARRFREEFAMTFGAWQRSIRVEEASRRLAEGQSVTRVALDLGYESVSAFSAMFRRSTGFVPSTLIVRKRGLQTASVHAASPRRSSVR